MDLLLQYGWIALAIAIVGEILVPFILAVFFKGYRHTTIVISTLGIDGSPTAIPFRLWMFLAGVLFILSTPVLYTSYSSVFPPLSVAVVVLLVIFAFGACILSAVFSVNETKDIITTASKIHGIGSAVGFMALLFVPLLLAILSFMAADIPFGMFCSISFGFALATFALFVMADKQQSMNTVVAWEGLWQRLSLLFMYLPRLIISLKHMLA